MSMLTNFELMARYNRWMNENLCRVASSLSADELARDRGAFFGSIIGTLNHVLVGDTLWLQRFAGQLTACRPLDYVRNLPAPTALNQLLYRELSDFTKAREALDRAIIAFVAELTEEILAGDLSYRRINGEQLTNPFAQVLLHFFNHQTHHRGQASTLFTQAGVDVGVTDMLMLIGDR